MREQCVNLLGVLLISQINFDKPSMGDSLFFRYLAMILASTFRSVSHQDPIVGGVNRKNEFGQIKENPFYQHHSRVNSLSCVVFHT